MASPWVMMSVAAAGAAVVAGVLVSCRSTVQAHAPMPMEELLCGEQSGVRDVRLAVARTGDELAALWREHGSLQLPPPAPPAVDFETSMVVAVFLGNRPTAGYGVRILGVAAAEGADGAAQLMVSTEESAPAADALTAQVTTAPFHMVVVPAAPGDAVLAEQ